MREPVGSTPEREPLVAWTVAAWTAALLAALTIWLAGCAETQYTQAGPDRIMSYDDIGMMPGRADTEQALLIVDQRLAGADLQPVRTLLRLTWLPVTHFTSDQKPGDRLKGMSEIVMRHDGLWCDIFIASDLQGRPSLTSLAHEMLHCSLGLTPRVPDGDSRHAEPEWNRCEEDRRPGCGWLDDTNARLHEAGL